MIEQLFYSVDELACLAAGFENGLNEKLDEIIPFESNQDIDLAKRKKILIVQHIKAKKLRLPERYEIIECDSYGDEICRLDEFINNINNSDHINWYTGTEQVIPTENIIKWAETNNITLNLPGIKTEGDPLKLRTSEESLSKSLGLMAILLAENKASFRRGHKPNGQNIVTEIERLIAKTEIASIDELAISNLRKDILTAFNALGLEIQ